jgi:dephospho-CoA kinase
MLKVGLTGGIGSGKSMVGKILQAMGFPVFYSDEAAKLCVDTHPEIRTKLIELLGNDAYENNILNRAYVAVKMFSDDGLRLKMNEIIHPKVRLLFNDFLEQKDSKIVFNEAAILIETGAYKMFDKTILVTAPNELKINRVLKREHCSTENVLERINKQWTDEKKIPFVDFILINDESRLLIPQIEQIITELTSHH